MTDQNILIQSSNTKKFSFYENFDGCYHKVGEIKELIPQFKLFYYAERRKDPQRSAVKVINDFNKQINPLTFFPWEKQYRLWRKKWDADLLEERGYTEQKQKVREVIKLRDEQNALIVPNDGTLETGAQILAGELLNDAMGILKKDQEDEEVYDEDIIVKRRNYVLNVFNYVTKSVHGKEALNLKSNSDKRETFGFLMTIMDRASAGKLTDDEMELLKQTVPPIN
ncbi:MAG: hypothetical protein HYZ51_00390 [Candidatus Doudnabacteria bacterium]|nr:hypothetical protein [Candidatus Doudnabacteria bacterium]